MTRALTAAASALALVSTLLALAAAAAATTPTDPLAAQQWYLAANRTFDAWTDPPPLAPVRVAIVDSGIDRANPEFRGRIAAARSFVGGTADDEQGHGTIVAGIIAANAGDGIGVAGSSPSAKLLVAKVVTKDGTVPIEAEARAIRWATDAGARVVNVSLGGLRDPGDTDRDTFSPLEREAVEYAVSRGVLVVAAVGNGDQAPTEPWRFASYPAATPQVLGVGALSRRGTVPGFSNRDPVYVDLVAPGEDVVSVFPLALTARSVDCADQGSTQCASGDYRDPEGTSFAAPQVTAAAATLFALQPSLRADQVRTILERSAVDVTPRDGCGSCAAGRDALSGFGRLDVAAAVAALADLPPADALEPNDDAGPQARKLWGARPSVRATVDLWDDPDDVYAVRIARGERVVATLAGPAVTRARLVLWDPATISVAGDAALARRLARAPGGATASVEWRATQSGWHLLQVHAVAPGPPIAYTLRIARGG